MAAIHDRKASPRKILDPSPCMELSGNTEIFLPYVLGDPANIPISAQSIKPI